MSGAAVRGEALVEAGEIERLSWGETRSGRAGKAASPGGYEHFVIRETVGHLRDLPRYRQILASLVRYGYQDVVSALHLEGLVRPLERVALGDDVPPQDRARRLRMVCEDLGPTFVKLGQLLSTAPRPSARGLHDRAGGLARRRAAVRVRRVRRDPDRGVRPASGGGLRARSTRRRWHRRRSRRSTAPCSPTAASVALKIRRPGIDKLIHADLDILKNLAQLAERRLAFLTPYAPTALAREFERSLTRELDFNVERRTIERCQAQFARDPTAHIPYVVNEYSNTRVIAMEFIGGVGVNDLEGLRQAGIDPAVVAIRGARILLRQIFEFGFFHADPHPGNLRVLPGGVVAPLDYGMFGQLDAADPRADRRPVDRPADAGHRPRAPRPRRPGDPRRARRRQGPAPRRRGAGVVVLRPHPRHDRPGDLAPRADRLHPRASPAHSARPGAPDPVAGDDRGRRPRARPPLRHRRTNFIPSSAT